MTNIFKISVLTVAILALPSCAGFQGDWQDQPQPAPVAQKADVTPPHQEQQKAAPAIPPNYACTNDVKFNITFSKNRHFAYIVLQDAPTKETLKDNHVASGAEYGNDKLLYKEYKGRTILMHSVQGKMRTDTCHKIKLKKKP